MEKLLVNKRKRLKFVRQLESLDCAPACLKMIAGYYGKNISLDYLRDICKTGKLGTSIYSLTTGAEKIGLDAVATQMEFSGFSTALPLPVILLWNKSHFIVLKEIVSAETNKLYDLFSLPPKFTIADPAFGLITISQKDFEAKWIGEEGRGIAIFLEPSDIFDKTISNPVEKKSSKLYFKKILKIFRTHSLSVVFVILGMLVSSGISLGFPVLTQRIVDIGIKFKDVDFIFLLLIFQLGLFFSMIIIDMAKSWVTLHLGAKIELSLTYDFLTKLMRLPLYFFDRKVAGDLMQRISDNSRIQNFLKSQVLDFFVSVATLISLSLLLLHYNNLIFVVFVSGSLLAILYTFYFIRKREILDYRKFDINTENTDNLIETIVAMNEVKLNNAEAIKLNAWKKIQLKLFNINTKLLLLQQYQNTGSTAIHQLKNIIVTYLAARQVITNNLSLGEMIGLSFIIGQLNVPLFQMVNFISNFQDSRISFQRLAEIQSKANEDDGFKIPEQEVNRLISGLHEIEISNLQFSYTESADDLLFDGLSLNIPAGKITALVGMSGSGKTTLMKLLLKFYEPLSGHIKVDNVPLNHILASSWRRRCGVVMQEGHIFTDTVEKNIAMSDENIDRQKLLKAAELSCIHSFVTTLPMGYSTRIGSGGMGISTGQKQRILIARAIYKNPDILFLDEATSSLDTNNEREIQNNLELFFKDKTVFLIAHRLSTVKNADNIIVLKGGKIIEQGNHEQLIALRGEYLSLIRNQLELGN